MRGAIDTRSRDRFTNARRTASFDIRRLVEQHWQPDARGRLDAAAGALSAELGRAGYPSSRANPFLPPRQSIDVGEALLTLAQAQADVGDRKSAQASAADSERVLAAAAGSSHALTQEAAHIAVSGTNSAGQ